MTGFKQKFADAAVQAGALALAVVFTSALLKAAGASPLETYRQLISGSVDSFAEFAYVLRGWVPLIFALDFADTADIRSDCRFSGG